MPLFLIPCPIAEDAQGTLPAYIAETVKTIDYFLVEELRTARRFVSGLKTGKVIEQLHFFELSKKTKPQELDEIFAKIPKGANVGVISEAGCPGVADPGALAVEYAHKHNIEVRPLVGPSSILLALMASGFNGQSFAFKGYLPIPRPERKAAIIQLETDSARNKSTQIFIETPFRSNQVLADLIETCRPDTRLCAAVELTSAEQKIWSMPIKQWKNIKVDLHKKAVVFLLYVG